MEDLQLLREYAEQRSENAFGDLVRRHVILVFSTALRVVGEMSLAEDVTQLVFIRLAQKAGSIRSGTILSGWLYRTTRNVAQTVLRGELRRRKREELAMQMTELDANSHSVWEGLAPLLEGAMRQLRPIDQDAVLLRFFEGKSLREVGQALSISDNAAQKRINRSLETVRAYFVRNGVPVSAAAIAPMIADHAVRALPPGLSESLVAASVAKAATAGATGAALSFLQVMSVSKLAISGVAAVILLLAGALVFVASSSPELGVSPPAREESKAAFALRGTVRTEDGKPLANALVRLATAQAQVRLYQTGTPVFAVAPATNQTNGVSPQGGMARSTMTARDGKFVFEFATIPKDMRMAIVATSEKGYALVTATELLSNPDVIVQPWGRVEGELRIGKSPGAHQVVNLGIWGSDATYDWSLVSHGVWVNTDERGQFVFPQVAPGDLWLTRTVWVRPKDGRQSGHQFIKVFAGQTNRVKLGGSGSTLTGRVVWDSGPVFHGSMWARQEHNMRPPPDWRQMPVDDRRLYERQWRNSPEGELFKREIRNYEFAVASNGTFRVEDVLPAHYRMQVRAEGFRIAGKTPIAEIEIDVPEPGEAEEDVLDIGDLQPNLAR